MPLSGTLSDFDISNIFLLLTQDEKTGSLLVQTAEGRSTILFRRGAIAYAELPKESIKTFIFRFLQQVKGYSAMETRELDAYFYNNSQLLSQELIKKGYLEEDELRKIVETALIDLTSSIFLYTEGRYHFENQPNVDASTFLSIEVPTNFILFEAARRNDEWVNIGKVITGESIFAPVKDRVFHEVYQPLDNFCNYLINYIREEKKVSEMCEELFLPKFHVYKALDAALQEGAISLIHTSDFVKRVENKKPVDKNEVPNTLLVSTSSLITGCIFIFMLVASLSYRLGSESRANRASSKESRYSNLIEDIRTERDLAQTLYKIRTGRENNDITNLVRESYITADESYRMRKYLD